MFNFRVFISKPDNEATASFPGLGSLAPFLPGKEAVASLSGLERRGGEVIEFSLLPPHLWAIFLRNSP